MLIPKINQLIFTLVSALIILPIHLHAKNTVNKQTMPYAPGTIQAYTPDQIAGILAAIDLYTQAGIENFFRHLTPEQLLTPRPTAPTIKRQIEKMLGARSINPQRRTKLKIINTAAKKIIRRGGYSCHDVFPKPSAPQPQASLMPQAAPIIPTLPTRYTDIRVLNGDALDRILQSIEAYDINSWRKFCATLNKKHMDLLICSQFTLVRWKIQRLLAQTSDAAIQEKLQLMADAAQHDPPQRSTLVDTLIPNKSAFTEAFNTWGEYVAKTGLLPSAPSYPLTNDTTMIRACTADLLQDFALYPALGFIAREKLEEFTRSLQQEQIIAQATDGYSLIETLQRRIAAAEYDELKKTPQLMLEICLEKTR